MTIDAAPRLRLVVPCYNEARRLRPADFLRFSQATDAARLVFVDDGSTDDTPRILVELSAASAGRIEVLTLPRNAGKAVAVRHGVLHAFAAGTPLVGYWDSDLSTPLDAVRDFLAVLDEHPAVDLVIGSRVKLLGRSIARRAWRHYVGRVFATGASLAVGLPVYDTQCGAKLFRSGEAVRAAFAEPFRSAWVFDVELLARYAAVVGHAAAEAQIFEFPLFEWNDVPGSKVAWTDGLRAARDLWRIRARRRASETR
jgi:dolichyl-phosphate beta-glucosyltransferase